LVFDIFMGSAKQRYSAAARVSLQLPREEAGFGPEL
jgi:hypothetical protein